MPMDATADLGDTVSAMRGQVSIMLPLGGRIPRRTLGLALALALILGLTGALFAASARADGDPASDYLQANQVFLAAEAPAATPAQRRLLTVVDAANRAGFGIRVAIIGSEYDLGSITELWRKPRLYARFLGLELSSVYRQRLLVVMPNGYGFNWPGHPSAAADRELAKLPVGTSSTAALAAAQAAVRTLAGAAGVVVGPATTLAPPTTSRPNSTAKAPAGGVSAAVVVVLAVLAVAVLAGFGVAVGRRRRRGLRSSGGTSVARAPAASSSRPRWVIPGFAALCLLAFAIPIAVVAATRDSNASAGPSTAVVVTPPPFSWPAGAHLAPAFSLRDQHGQPVSVSAYRGHPVIVTFVDPLCRNLCPLEAHVLNAAVAEMPAAQRPTILAVSVNVYANKRADLLQDVRKWSLVPQWHWAVGSRAALAAAWKQYKIGVSVVTKRIAGNTINYITHTEAAYVIDSSGHERALFVWPFYPQDVVRTLRQVS
jgi:cytochrome oxidase Cu insertion factor (SCO1/SenC/PrrC family)